MRLKPNSQSIETLLHTKMEIPVLATRVLRRSRLTTLFERLGERKVTILVAPAGYGKTTLLGDWLSQTSLARNRTAWITLNLFDNAPVRFLSYLVAAIKKTYRGINFDEHSLLTHGFDPLDLLKLNPLINEISNLPGRINLILDDYHVITDPQINSGVAYLIEHQPANLHLVISSRRQPEIPFSRLRTSGRLVEITTSELAFTFEETRKYLGESSSERLSPNEIVKIFHNTKGWVAGLQMTTLTHEKLSEVQLNRVHEPQENPTFPKYFSEVVLENQEPSIREFLLQTSILTDFSNELCNDLLDRDDSQTIIDQLVSQNLFIEPVDSRRNWYRYHPLFAVSLSEQLLKTDPTTINILHNKALQWFIEKGLPEKAVIHALNSGNAGKAAEIIDAVALQAIINFDVIKLIHWINAIPDQLLTLRPRLGIYNAVSFFLLGQYEMVLVNLIKVENVLHDPNLTAHTSEEQKKLRWEIDAVRIAVKCLSGDHIQGLTEGLRLLDNELMRDNFIYAMLTHAIGLCLENQGMLDKAVRVFDTARQYGLEHKYFYGYLHSSVALAHVLFKQGKLNEANFEYAQALDFAIKLKLENATISLAQTGLLEIALEQNNIPVSDRLAAEIVINFDKTVFSVSAWISHIDRCVYLTNYFITKNDQKNAREYLDSAVSSFYDHSTVGNPMPASLLDAFVRVARFEAKNTGSMNWLQAALEFLTPASLNTPAGQMIQARIYLDQENPEAATILLSNLIKNMRQSELRGQLLQCLVLYALALYANSEKESAFSVIEEALTIGVSHGNIRVFIEEGDQIKGLLSDYKNSSRSITYESANPGYLDILIKLLDMESLDKSTPHIPVEPVMTAIHPLQEPLSEREAEVLKMLISEMSTKEIADSLMISINTVKTHIKNIYRKYDVHSHHMLVNRVKEQVI